MDADLRVCIVSASGQNVYFEEILSVFADALTAQGVPVEHSVDCFPPLQQGLVYLFVPHEFHPLVEDAAHPGLSQLSRSVAVCTEQPGTTWFDVAVDIASLAGGVVDINRVGITELSRLGIEAHHAPLGYVSSWDHWRRNQGQERTIDVAFLGGATERRERALSHCGDLLSQRRAEIHLTENFKPHVSGGASFLAGDEKWDFLSNTKILLNVHRSKLPYFEWHRVTGAILNGCVVLTEHSRDFEPFVPGEHFFSARYEDLHAVLEGLLTDESRLAEVRNAAYDLIKNEMPLQATSAGLLKAIERAASQPATGAGGLQGLPEPRPKPLPQIPAGWELAEQASKEFGSIPMALKHLVIRTRAIERRLADIESPGEEQKIEVERLGPDLPAARISVLLTVYNYAHHVQDAIGSVALSDLADIEIVAVDDASTDDSVEAIRAASEKFPWLPVTLVRCARNQGLPAARNLAADYARSDLLFVLDADNAVYRSGLRQLEEVLRCNADASFAYGLIQRFDTDGPAGVMSWLDWDPARLRWGNYIDAMALIRRADLEEVGGYSTDPALYGWEDFALWVAMADAGKRGVRVPNFVARYRSGPHSMISLTDIDHTAAWANLIGRYPRISADPIA